MIRAKEDEQPKRPIVTKALRVAISVTPVTKPKGRPKLHKSPADKQRAYRQRKAKES